MISINLDNKDINMDIKIDVLDIMHSNFMDIYIIPQLSNMIGT